MILFRFGHARAHFALIEMGFPFCSLLACIYTPFNLDVVSERGSMIAWPKIPQILFAYSIAIAIEVCELSIVDGDYSVPHNVF